MFQLGWFANPLYHGDYPKVMKERIAYRSSLEGLRRSRLPEFNEDEKTYIRGTMDFFCLQSYYVCNVSSLGEPELDTPPSIEKDLATKSTLIHYTQVCP